MVRPDYGTYADVAKDYYDPHLHPTCSNFGAASEKILDDWLPQFWPGSGWVCEVGAGRSLTASVALASGHKVDRLIISDLEPEMLVQSIAAIEAGAHPVLANAFRLPFKDNCFSLVVASLGDPFNTRAYWAEVFRVLMDGGITLFTTPAYQWSSKFRRQEGAAKDFAEFTDRQGERVLVPSAIYPKQVQFELMKSAGLTVLDHRNVSVKEIGQASLSPKLNCAEDGVIVSGFLAKAGRAESQAKART